MAPFERFLVIETNDFAIKPDAQEALAHEELGEVNGIGLCGHGHTEDDERGLARMLGEQIAQDAFARLGSHGTFALRARCFRETREDHFEVVIDLRDRADGAACAANVVGLLDGDRGRDAFVLSTFGLSMRSKNCRV